MGSNHRTLGLLLKGMYWASVGLLSALAGCAPIGVVPDGGTSATTYAGTIREALQAYASDMQGYHFRATPVGNFGVGSIYLDDVSDPDLSKVESSWFLGSPEDWLSPSTPKADRQRLLSRMIAEGSLGTFSSRSRTSRAVNSEAGVAILSALTGASRLDYRKGVVTSFRATEIVNRRLNWAEFQAALKAGHISPAVTDVIQRGKFVVAAADIVLIGYQAEVAVDENLNPALAASLRTNILLPRSRGAQVSFSLSESSRGHFVARAKQPVVAAVLFKRPPATVSKAGPMPSIDAWPTAKVNKQSINSIEAHVLKHKP